MSKKATNNDAHHTGSPCFCKSDEPKLVSKKFTTQRGTLHGAYRITVDTFLEHTWENIPGSFYVFQKLEGLPVLLSLGLSEEHHRPSCEADRVLLRRAATHSEASYHGGKQDNVS